MPLPNRSIAVAGLFVVLLLFIAAIPARAFETTADYAVLMDSKTGRVLWEKQGDEQMAPASMSKLMTLEMVFSALKNGSLQRDETFTVSENAWRKGGIASGSSTMFLEVGSQVPVIDLIRGIIVQSGNDACIVVAENMSGSEAAFAEKMNERAKELGLTNSHFANSTGWPDPEQYMSPLDLAKLAQHLIEDYPTYYPIFKEREYTWNGITQRNRNMLLFRDPTVDGLKTGHTEASGYGEVVSAKRDGERLVLVVNGLSSEVERANEAERLLNWGFREFRPYDLLEPDAVVAYAPVWHGARRSVALSSGEPANLVLSPEQARDVKLTAVYNAPVNAPIEAGQRVGTLRVTAPGMPPYDFPLVANETVEKAGFLGRAIQSIGAALSDGDD